MSRYLTLTNGVRQWASAIATSTGTADAAKLICTNAAGAIDESFLLGAPIGSPEGLTLSRNASFPNTRLDIAPGRAIVAEGSLRFVAISPGIFTKRLDAVWAIGSGNGGRFAGSVAANQTWHVFIMRRSSDGLIDFGFDTSATAANAPAGWSERLIGSIMTDGSGNIRDFLQIGDRFYWNPPITDLNTLAAPTATTNLQTLSVPLGLVMQAFGIVAAGNSNGALIFGGSPAYSAIDVAQCWAGGAHTRTPFHVLTNTAAQTRLYSSAANTFLALGTQGFIHPRGAW